MLYYKLWAKGPQNFQKCRNHQQDPSVKGVKLSKFYTVDSHFWRGLWTSLLSGIPVFRIRAPVVWDTHNVIKYTIHKNKYTISYPSSRLSFQASSITPVLQCTTFQNLALLPSWDEQNEVKKNTLFRFTATNVFLRLLEYTLPHSYVADFVYVVTNIKPQHWWN